MIYTGLNRTGEIESVKAHGGSDVAEVYGSINESNPIYYKAITITGTSPLTFKGLGLPLKDYCIYGNTVQDGTPTPDNPVDVVGCGVRTENLFDLTDYTSGYNISLNGEIVANSNYALSGYIFCTAGTYTLSGKNTYNTTANIANRAILYDENKENPVLVLGATGSKPVDFEYTFQILESGFLVFSFRVTDINIMLNLDSTAKPYEPYGYKLPLAVTGAEYPIYLGQVPTTRRIKKLVFDGTENWFYQYVGQHGAISIRKDELPLTPRMQPGTLTILSTHFKAISNSTQLDTGEMVSGTSYLNFDYDGTNDPTVFKSWLAAQYAAGTPVTVWYVLATPETGIVNEPLHKIGDYADTISMAQAGVTIPTVAGTNTLTVDTTVQPSAVSITGNIKEVSR